MISKQQAHTIAKDELARAIAENDSPLRSWPQAVTGEPVTVHDVNGYPSYWIVPFETKGSVVGFTRILATGWVYAVGSFCADADSINRCPKQVTGLSAQQAREKVAKDTELTAEETMAEPLFVHDGPIGRETWLVVIRVNATPTRWLFVSQGGIYERPAGQELPTDAGIE